MATINISSLDINTEVSSLVKLYFLRPTDLSTRAFLVSYQSYFQVVLVRSKFAQKESIVDTVEEIVDVCLNRGSIGNFTHELSLFALDVNINIFSSFLYIFNICF